MAINRTYPLFYEVAGALYKDFAEAQKADLLALMPADLGLTKDGIFDWMLQNAEAIAIILQTTPRSRRRKPRKDKGVPRKKKTETPTPIDPL